MSTRFPRTIQDRSAPARNPRNSRGPLIPNPQLPGFSPRPMLGHSRQQQFSAEGYSRTRTRNGDRIFPRSSENELRTNSSDFGSPKCDINRTSICHPEANAFAGEDRTNDSVTVYAANDRDERGLLGNPGKRRQGRGAQSSPPTSHRYRYPISPRGALLPTPRSRFRPQSSRYPRSRVRRPFPSSQSVPSTPINVSRSSSHSSSHILPRKTAADRQKEGNGHEPDYFERDIYSDFYEALESSGCGSGKAWSGSRLSSGAQRSNASTPDVERKKTKEAGVEEEDQRSVAMDLERETSPVSEEEVDGPPSGCVLKRKFSDISCDSDDHSKDEVVDSVESDAFEGYIEEGSLVIDLAVAVEGASSTPTESTEPPGFELLQKSPAAQVNSQVDANGVTVKKLSTDAPEDSCGLEEKNVWSAGKSITPVINDVELPVVRKLVRIRCCSKPKPILTMSCATSATVSQSESSVSSSFEKISAPPNVLQTSPVDSNSTLSPASPDVCPETEWPVLPPAETERIFRPRSIPVRRRANSCPSFEPEKSVVRGKDALLAPHIHTRSFSPISEASNTSSNEENESCGISLLSFSQLRKQGNLALPSSMFNLDPYRSAVRKMIPATTPHCADIWAFYDALELVDTAKDTLPTSWQYHGLFKQLHATMDAAVAYGRWFCADDPPSDQLAVHFLIVLKTHLLNHIRDSPLVGLVDNSMDLSTRMALEMLWKAIHLVEHVAFLIAEMGVAVCLVDLTFSPSVSSSCKAIALNILEAFLLLVPSHRILQIIGEQYRKNSTGSMESRLDKLLELRLSVEIPLELLFDSDENDVSAERAVMEMTILVLEKLLTSAMEWRRFLVQNPPSGRSLVDEGGVVWSCVKKGGFLPWFSKVARKILLSEEGNVKGFRLRMVVVEVLDLLVRDGFGVAFLAMELQSKTGSSLIEVMEELASKSLDLTATNWLDNFSLARQICTCLDKLEEEGPSQSQRAIISRLSDFVWNKDTAAITVSILTGKEPLDCLRKCLDELHAPSVDYVWRCLLNGLVQQYAGKEAVVVVLGEFAEKVVHKQKQVRWPMGECVLRVWRMYKEGLPPMRLLQWLVTTLADTLSRSLTDCDDYVYVLLDTCLYLLSSSSGNREKIALTLRCTPFLAFVQLLSSIPAILGHWAISGLGQSTLLWENMWIKVSKVFTICVDSGLVPPSTALQVFMDAVAMTCRPDLTVRDATRRAVQAELSRSLSPLIKELGNVVDTEDLAEKPVVQAILSASHAVMDYGRPLVCTWAYLTLVNRLWPDHLVDATAVTNIEQASLQTNWEFLIRLDQSKLQKIVCSGLLCSVPYVDLEFRLWVWRYCELSGSAAHEMLSTVWLTMHTAITGGINRDAVAQMLRKVGSLLKVASIRRRTLRFLESADSSAGWRPDMFLDVVNLLKTGAVYSRPCGDALLFLVSQLLARLLRSPGLPLTSVVDITSGWIFRLECEPSVPVILGLYPIIRAQLLSNAKSFLDASRERPVLNWILLAIARELHGDPSKSFLVDLATMMVSLFSHLIKIEGGVEVWWRLCGCGGVGQERDPVVVCCDGFADVLPENVGKFLEVCQSVVEGSCRLDGEDLVETSVGHGSEESEEGESCLYGKWQMQQIEKDVHLEGTRCLMMDQETKVREWLQMLSTSSAQI